MCAKAVNALLILRHMFLQNSQNINDLTATNTKSQGKFTANFASCNKEVKA